MKHYDTALKMYADSGLRTAQDWAQLGRDLKTESRPCAHAQHRGVAVPLYSRDQTRAIRRNQ